MSGGCSLTTSGMVLQGTCDTKAPSTNSKSQYPAGPLPAGHHPQGMSRHYLAARSTQQRGRVAVTNPLELVKEMRGQWAVAMITYCQGLKTICTSWRCIGLNTIASNIAPLLSGPFTVLRLWEVELPCPLQCTFTSSIQGLLSTYQGVLLTRCSCQDLAKDVCRAAIGACIL